MPWRIKAVNPYASPPTLEWLGPVLPSLTEGHNVLERVRLKSPESEFEEQLIQLMAIEGARLWLSVDDGPTPAEPSCP